MSELLLCCAPQQPPLPFPAGFGEQFLALGSVVLSVSAAGLILPRHQLVTPAASPRCPHGAEGCDKAQLCGQQPRWVCVPLSQLCGEAASVGSSGFAAAQAPSPQLLLTDMS